MYSVDADGTGYSVQAILTTATHGQDPQDTVALGADGTIYGAGYTGGALGFGAVFSTVPSVPPPSPTGIAVVRPTTTTAGSMTILKDITFNITVTGTTQLVVLDEWVTSDGTPTFYPVSGTYTYSINGAANQTLPMNSLLDNSTGGFGAVSANDGYFYPSSAIPVAAGNTFTIRSGTYVLPAAGNAASFNPQANQTFTGNVFLVNSAGTRISDIVQLGGPAANTAPTDITLSSATIAENNTAGATIGTLTATDSNLTDTHTFTFAGGADDGAFTITGATLKINGSADFETKSSYAIRIRATDSGTGNLTFEKNFTVTITDVTIPQTIIFGALGGKTFGDAAFAVSATGGAGGQPVTFSIFSGPATIVGSTVTLTGAGSVTVRASQAGVGDYSAAASVDQTFSVAKAAQSISFTNPGAHAFGDAAFALVATGGGSGEAVTFSIVSGPASVAGNLLTITGAGSITVRASQVGNADYFAAADAEQTFSAATAAQTITFAALGGKTFGDAAFTVSATGGAGGEPVTFSIVSGPATIAGNLVSITGAGDVTVRASQAGAGNYAAATPVDRTFTVAKAAQSIAFTAPATIGTGDSVTLSATGGANGNAVTFSVFSGPGSLAGNVLTFSGAGTVVVRASQAGNADYLAAADVDATINVVINSAPIAVDDAVRITAGVATVYPLANDSDADGDELSITAVSESSVEIDGRTLIVPAGYSGTFTYTVSDGISSDTANVVVTPGTPQSARNRWSGLLTDSTGAIVGRMSATRTTKGSFSASVRVGATSIVSTFSLRPEPNGTAIVPTTLGNLTVTENDAAGRLNVSLVHSGGPFTGSLRRSALTGTVQTHNVALASIDAAYPGGGIARVSVRNTGFVVLTVTLPDGKTLSAKSDLADNGTFTIYSPVSLTSPTAYVAGEFNFANLAATDVTGELAWIKPAQTAAGLHQSGVSTTLTANGCVFAPGVSTLPAGAGTLTISGGNLASSNTTARTITAGKPTVNALVPAWTAFPLKGTFTAKVKTPANARTVTGSGIYLPKSNSAWGFFPGTTLGGRMVLTQP